jgi:hypothetical protein
VESAPANHARSGLSNTLDHRSVRGGDLTVEPGSASSREVFLIDDVFDHHSQALERTRYLMLRPMIDQRARVEKILVFFEPGEGLSR